MINAGAVPVIFDMPVALVAGPQPVDARIRAVGFGILTFERRVLPDQ